MQTMVMILCALLFHLYDIKDENVTQKILLNMIELFKELKKQYPKNIQIKE